MIPYTYALHKIDNNINFGFHADDYSRFKFGDELVAKAFGKQLANGFIKDFLEDNLASEQIVVISSPYCFIPTATFAMKNYFVYQLNNWLVDQGRLVVQEAKIHRTITYKDDYGELNAEERMKLIGNDSFHIDKDFLKDKILFFLDDIKITGSHEKMILRMVKEYGLKNDIFMLYFAELVNHDIHPNIENFLNYHQIKSVFDLDEIIQGGNFCFNTRIVKYILNCDFNSFSIFLERQSDDFIHSLYNLALGNSYHTIACYSKNLTHLKKYITNNNLKLT
ncbi:phosphoribosyltransferase family protein [Pedobacter metabolipauper]|uniref:Phosphoribosyl transferase-like protein n=1 Tax=Pedobacter metabolipauper TaxID=425513 RepID=A0A4R6T0Y0_9SPHI|nr:phosphoribosyltransferase family protein [Pedobacter metabolipauper]TDQ12047.1 phosphoribosyl transferase-like protein [Pedobacter metabolipauper]